MPFMNKIVSPAVSKTRRASGKTTPLLPQKAFVPSHRYFYTSSYGEHRVLCTIVALCGLENAGATGLSARCRKKVQTCPPKNQD